MIYDSSNPGERLRFIREKRGLTQIQLQKLLNVPKGKISDWETGRREIKADDVVLICSKLGISCDWFLTGVGTRDLRFCNDTGLSAETIEKIKSDPFVNCISGTINSLLSTEQGIHILEHIDSFIHDKPEFELYYHDQTPVDDWVMEKVTLVDIMNLLIKSKEELKNGQKCKRARNT